MVCILLSQPGLLVSVWWVYWYRTEQLVSWILLLRTKVVTGTRNDSYALFVARCRSPSKLFTDSSLRQFWTTTLAKVRYNLHLLSSSSNFDKQRDRHVSVAYENTFYVHGGFDGQSRDNRLFAFDFSSMTWREIIANQGRSPSARHSHSGTCVTRTRKNL